MNSKKSSSSSGAESARSGPSSGASTPLARDKVADRARRIWEERGRPEGRDLEHWLEAERQLRVGDAKTNRAGNSGELTREDVESDKNVDGLVQRPRER